MRGHVGQIVRILPEVNSPFAGQFAVIATAEEPFQDIEPEKYHVLPDGMVLDPVARVDWIDSEWFNVDQLQFLSTAEEEEAKQYLPHYAKLREGWPYSSIVGR